MATGRIYALPVPRIPLVRSRCRKPSGHHAMPAGLSGGGAAREQINEPVLLHFEAVKVTAMGYAER